MIIRKQEVFHLIPGEGQEATGRDSKLHRRKAFLTSPGNSELGVHVPHRTHFPGAPKEVTYRNPLKAGKRLEESNSRALKGTFPLFAPGFWLRNSSD